MALEGANSVSRALVVVGMTMAVAMYVGVAMAMAVTSGMIVVV